MQTQSVRRLPQLISLVLIAGMLFHASVARAAERIVLEYGILRKTVSIADLTTLAETGQPPAALQAFLRIAKQDPEKFRQVLTQPVELNPLLLDQILNSPLGQLTLDELGKTIHTPTGTADRQALRAALILSAVDDNKVSLLEVFQKYPTTEMQVDVARLAGAYQRIDNLAGRVQKVIESLQILQ